MTKTQILEAAALRYGRRFKTLREIEIYLIRHEQQVGDVEPDEWFRTGFAAMKPKHYDDTANCVGEHSEELKANDQFSIRTMLTLTPRNNLWVDAESKKKLGSIKLSNAKRLYAEIWS